MNIDDYNTLTQITDTTWGRASTDATPTMSVKMSFVGEDVAVVKYVTVVTYAGHFTPQMQRDEFDIAKRAVEAYIKTVKKTFKQETGRAVKLKLRSLDPSVDVIDINTFSPLRAVQTVYYRCTGDVEVG